MINVASEPIEVIDPAPVERVTPLKVSEAIRLGAMVSKPIVGRLRKQSKGVVYACAVGAAANAFGIPRYSRAQYDTIDKIMGPNTLSCPVVEQLSDKLGRRYDRHCPERWAEWSQMIVHINDNHYLPREWIADYLESLGF